MVHTVHMMLGGNAEPLLLNLRQYVRKYGDDEANSFFHALLYREDDATAATFREAVIRKPDESVFVAGLENMISVELDGGVAIPANHRAEYLANYFADRYNEWVTINHSGDSAKLHICLYVPTYLASCWERCKEFLTSMDSLPQQFNVDLLLLPYDVAFLMEEEVENLPERLKDYELQTAKTLKELIEIKPQFKSLAHALLIQNCNARGVALGLDSESFVRIVGEYALLSITNYPELYNQAVESPDRPLYTLGLSVLSFDKYYFVQYLLYKAYLSILEREQVSQSEVDVNLVSNIVQKILEKNVKIFTTFYDTHVKPRLDAQMAQADIIDEVTPLLKGEISRLTAEFQAYIDDPKLSLPEKRATLAQLIGEDDELLSGYMFNRQQLDLDDCAREVLDLYVDFNNKLFASAAQGKMLGGDDEKEGLALAEHASLSVREGKAAVKASELLNEIKALKVKMRSSTNYIRTKQRELSETTTQIDEIAERDKRLTEEGFIYGENTFRLLPSDIEETPCAEDYQPMTSSLPEKVDLRSLFTPIKNQQDIGACSAFTIVGIFEHILKKNKRTECDLSEAYAYFRARQLQNREGEDSGMSLTGLIKALQEYGVCLESLCEYSLQPTITAEADADAEQRKILKTLNVKVDIEHIKSAVAEGYPVAISLRIFDSFNPVAGFISLPTQEEKVGDKRGNHAMIVCGYSEAEKIFIVRNSWGTAFGDRGYCYIPYSYLADPELLNYACIVAQISDSSLQVAGRDDKLTFSFDMSNSKIKAAILRNLINEEKLLLNGLDMTYREKLALYEGLFQNLCKSDFCNPLDDGTCRRLRWERHLLERRKVKLQDERVNALSNFDKRTRWGHITYWLVKLYIVLSYGLWYYLENRYDFVEDFAPIDIFGTKFSYWVYGIIALGAIIYFFWWRDRKLKRSNLDNDYQTMTQQLAREIGQLQAEEDTTHLRAHLAGMIIGSLSKLFRNLHKKYSSMRSCVSNLSQWYTETRAITAVMEPLTRDPFLSLIANPTLDRYFQQHEAEITNGVTLYEMFQNRYEIGDEQIVAFKNSIKKELMDLLFEPIKDFSVYKHVTGETTYPYIDRTYTDIHALLQSMDRKSELFVRTTPRTLLEGLTQHSSKLLFVKVNSPVESQRWSSECKKSFHFSPMIQTIDSDFKITLLKITNLAPEEVALLAVKE